MAIGAFFDIRFLDLSGGCFRLPRNRSLKVNTTKHLIVQRNASEDIHFRDFEENDARPECLEA